MITDQYLRTADEVAMSTQRPSKLCVEVGLRDNRSLRDTHSFPIASQTSRILWGVYVAHVYKEARGVASTAHGKNSS